MEDTSVQSLNAQIVAFWNDTLIPISSQLLESYALSRTTRNFLELIGLPSHAPLFITFYTNSSLLTACSSRNEQYVIIGDDYGTKIGIKEITDEVFSVHATTCIPIRFINSTIQYLLLFLRIYMLEQPALAAATDADATKIVERIRLEFIKLDAKAVADPENWWSLILEQSEQGLL